MGSEMCIRDRQYFNPTPRGAAAFTKIDGKIYGSGSTPTFGASGLAVAWAEENTRESLYEAFRRKEVFATSGPRIKLRFFGGYSLDATMMESIDGIESAYSRGVTMGAELGPSANTDEAQTPNFIVMASADPLSAPLQRIQVIKGWVDADGETHEAVIDVALSLIHI